MALTPSPYRNVERVDGGPFLKVELRDAYGLSVAVGDPDARSSVVWFSDVDTPHTSADNWLLLLIVEQDVVTIYPRVWSQHSTSYGEYKHYPLKALAIRAESGQRYELPFDQESLEGLLSELPPRFKKDWRYGLGLPRTYESIPRAIAKIEGLDSVVFHRDPEYQDVQVVGSCYHVGIDAFEELCGRLDRVSDRYQRSAAQDKDWVTHAALLHDLAPERYPTRSRQLPPDVLKDLVGLGRDKLSKADGKAAAKLVNHNARALAREEPETLNTLKAD